MENVTIQIQISKNAQTVINNLKNVVAKSPTGVGFVSVKGYENKYNEVSNNLINVGASYPKAIEKDVLYLKDLDITTIDSSIDVITLEKARVELLNAFLKPNLNRSNGQKNAYTNITTGLKVHNETGALYVWGFRVKKIVISDGTYPIVNSRVLTIAKNILRKNLKTSKFTQYKISNIETMTLNGQTLEF